MDDGPGRNWVPNELAGSSLVASQPLGRSRTSPIRGRGRRPSARGAAAISPHRRHPCRNRTARGSRQARWSVRRSADGCCTARSGGHITRAHRAPRAPAHDRQTRAGSPTDRRVPRPQSARCCDDRTDHVIERSGRARPSRRTRLTAFVPGGDALTPRPHCPYCPESESSPARNSDRTCSEQYSRQAFRRRRGAQCPGWSSRIPFRYTWAQSPSRWLAAVTRHRIAGVLQCGRGITDQGEPERAGPATTDDTGADEVCLSYHGTDDDRRQRRGHCGIAYSARRDPVARISRPAFLGPCVERICQVFRRRRHGVGSISDR